MNISASTKPFSYSLVCFCFAVKGDALVQQNGEPVSLILAKQASEPDSSVAVKPDCQPAEAQVVSQSPELAVLKEEIKKEKVKLFGKMFKKKAEAPADVKRVQGKETSSEDQTDASPPAADPQPVSRRLMFVRRCCNLQICSVIHITAYLPH